MKFQPRCELLTVSSDDRPIVVEVLSSPDGDALNPALLLSFAMDRQTSLHMEPYNLTAQRFLEQGHRVLSFDLPNHGERVDEFGEGIEGLSNAFVAGQDRFAEFVKDAAAVIDECVKQGLAESARIAVCGTSRAGYLALRLLAADARIAVGAVLAPVTDWRLVSEFAAQTEMASVEKLRLSHSADDLAGKPVFMAIGNHDGRVGTAACCRFYLDLLEANARQGHDDLFVEFIVDATAGHFSSAAWYESAARFLLQQLQNAAQDDTLARNAAPIDWSGD